MPDGRGAVRHAESLPIGVHYAVSETKAKLEVKDYGKGIDPELLREFERTGGGAGIGLASVRERLRELDGRLEVEAGQHGTLIRALSPFSISAAAKKSGSRI